MPCLLPPQLSLTDPQQGPDTSWSLPLPGGSSPLLGLSQNGLPQLAAAPPHPSCGPLPGHRCEALVVWLCPSQPSGPGELQILSQPQVPCL